MLLARRYTHGGSGGGGGGGGGRNASAKLRNGRGDGPPRVSDCEEAACAGGGGAPLAVAIAEDVSTTARDNTVPYNYY